MQLAATKRQSDRGPVESDEWADKGMDEVVDGAQFQPPRLLTVIGLCAHTNDRVGHQDTALTYNRLSSFARWRSFSIAS